MIPKTQARQNLIEAMRKVQTALKQVRIIPRGSKEPIPPVPDEVEVDEADLRDISELWDETMPDYVGMLDAEVVRRNNA